jgi:para-nitrobenzyl esterase
VKNYILFGIVLVASTVAVKSQNVTPESTDIVKISDGTLAGLRSDDNQIISFKGIPFAAPPVGDGRWKAPQPVVKWTGIKTCYSYSASPMQPKPVPFNVYTAEFLIPEEPIGEDCLYLNVWKHMEPSKDMRPVFVWIYGGGFNSGGASVPLYDGEAMARKGVIFVSINYRVGIFGFFSHPELTKESPNNASGNYGLMDQIAALKWIQNNIEAFGGDKNNVTIAGQSAGSMSVNCLVVSPLARGLFHKAIAESGANLLPTSPVNTSSLVAEESKGLKVGSSLNTPSVSALRSLSAQYLQDNVKERFGPIVDGYVLPQSISKIFSMGKQADVPLLTGWNEDESFAQVQAKEVFLKEMGEKYGSRLPEFLTYYPASTEEEAAASQVNVWRDRVFAVSNYQWAIIQSERTKPAYVYYFKRRPPATLEFVKYKAFHTAEVAYALNNLKFVNRKWEPIDHTLANIISSYWVNFAKTGNPNGKGLPPWPAYSKKDSGVIVLSEAPAASIMPGKAALDFLYSFEK